jgi:hypothetical protein
MKTIFKKYFLFSLLLFFTAQVSFAQFNLVPNPSFEIFDTCPHLAGQIRFAPPWISPQIGYTPDYFNVCDTTPLHQVGVPDNYVGFQYARTGFAYALVATAWFPGNPAAWNYREYIEVELTDSLIGGVDYCVRWYVSACDSCHYISNNIGIYFSDTTISYPCPGCPSPLPFSPQFENPLNHDLNDRFGWTEISGTYWAAGGEKFILIGNFRDTSQTTTTYTGWSNPNSNLYDAAAYFLDDVLITPCDSLTTINENQINHSINVYPNPFYNQINIHSNVEPLQEIYLRDIVGRIILLETNIQKQKKEIILTNLSDGIYLLKIRTNKSEFNFKIEKINSPLNTIKK